MSYILKEGYIPPPQNNCFNGKISFIVIEPVLAPDVVRALLWQERRRQYRRFVQRQRRIVLFVETRKIHWKNLKKLFKCFKNKNI